jgi:hypothetical protein
MNVKRPPAPQELQPWWRRGAKGQRVAFDGMATLNRGC